MPNWGTLVAARLEPEDQQIALAVAQKRHNPLVSTALVRAMFDPQEQLWRIRTRSAAGQVETRTVTRHELESLRNTGVVIESADVIKEAGVRGVIPRPDGSRSGSAGESHCGESAGRRRDLSSLARCTSRAAARPRIPQGAGD